MSMRWKLKSASTVLPPDKMVANAILSQLWCYVNKSASLLVLLITTSCVDNITYKAILQKVNKLALKTIFMKNIYLIFKLKL